MKSIVSFAVQFPMGTAALIVPQKNMFMGMEQINVSIAAQLQPAAGALTALQKSMKNRRILKCSLV
jgi:hypothetical protein